MKTFLFRWALGAMLLAAFVFNPISTVKADLEINIDGLEEDFCDWLDTDDEEGESTSGLLQCSDEEGSSFTDFEGDFSPPDEEGYAEGITTTSSAREFIVNVTNFVLSFLGLAAIVVIIYGGFLYVTAGGEQEKADKGKKSVYYAVIGIIVVLISYALVNTIIQGAASGEDTTSSDSLYTSSGDVSSDSLTEFRASEMVENLQDIAEAFLDEYTAVVNVSAILQAMANVGTFDDDGLGEMQEGLDLIMNEIDSLSDTADLVRDAQQYLNGYISFQWFEKFQQLAGYSEWGQANVLLAVSADATTTDEYDPYGISSDVIDDMENISEQSVKDFINGVGELTDELEALQISFENLTTINDLFKTVLDSDHLGGYGTAGSTSIPSGYTSETFTFEYVSGAPSATLYTEVPGGSSQAGKSIEILNEIYNLIQELEFTTAIINANTNQGNAPVIVTFDALDSYDPTDQTIQDDQYQWDLLGNGFEGGDDATGPIATYTYENPGTYRVALRVESSDTANIASGISYLSVKVNPPSSIIQLDATVNGSTTDLTEETTYTVTRDFASQGITFDASGTTDGQGNADAIIDYEFDFGDRETQEGENPAATHYYMEEGTYGFILEVKDQNGVTDRKLVDIVVSSPAARVEVSSPTADIGASEYTAEIGETVTFDASASMTDNGAIEHYDWEISKDGSVLETKEGGGEEWSYTFESPGSYTITVTVTDSTGESNAASLSVVVVSSPPVPLITYDIPDDTHPNRVILNASHSTDPDPGDEELLTYLWEINGTSGTDYDFVDGYDDTMEQTLVEFHAVGDWEVTLTASDPHDDDLQQSASITETVEVDSILTLDISTVGSAYAILDSTTGQATVEVSLESSTGVSYTVDWQDGGTAETIPVTSVGTAQSVSHIYTQAGTYSITVKVYDSSGASNQKSHNLYIGNGTAPIPIVSITVDDLDQSSEGTIEGSRISTFKFDASESVDASGKILSDKDAFKWTFGDGTQANGRSSVSKQYSDVGEYEVTLKVDSVESPGVYTTTTFNVGVVSMSPEIYTLTADPLRDDLITPLQVSVEVNAEDPDGTGNNDGISQYRFWYYDVENSAEDLGMTITNVPYAILTINTNGDTGDVHEYGFVVEVIDSENNSIDSLTELGEARAPTLEVENGPNQPPTADFSVDQTSILVGETITFLASAGDEDGNIVEYVWDVEGDGFYNNTDTDDATLVYTYETAAPDGIEVRLKVTDNGGATGISDPITIYVDSLTDDPEAAFTASLENRTVTFTNNSTADTENGASLTGVVWDFDTSVDSNGNGIKDDDTNSAEQNPTHTYDEYGSYKVKLTVVDNEGSTDEVTQTVVVAESNPPEAAFSASVSDLAVTFTNNSSVEGSGLTLTSYAWDFDLKTDSDGNGDEDDDVDSTTQNPTYTYNDYGIYTVQLTVTDSLGRTDDVSQTVELKASEEELIAYLTSSPEADPSDGKVHLTGSSGSITFSFSANGVTGDVTYCIDKNVYYDSDGDGDKDNDCNHEATSSGSYSTDFEEAWGLIVVKLTVTDSAERSDSVTLEIKFDEEESTTSTNLLPVTTAEALYILATALGFTLLGAKLYSGRKKEEE